MTHTSKKAHVGACNRLQCKTSVRKSEPEHHINWHVNELLGYIHMWLKIVILQATQGLFESIYVCMCVCVLQLHTTVVYSTNSKLCRAQHPCHALHFNVKGGMGGASRAPCNYQA